MDKADEQLKATMVKDDSTDDDEPPEKSFTVGLWRHKSEKFKSNF